MISRPSAPMSLPYPKTLRIREHAKSNDSNAQRLLHYLYCMTTGVNKPYLMCLMGLLLMRQQLPPSLFMSNLSDSFATTESENLIAMIQFKENTGWYTRVEITCMLIRAEECNISDTMETAAYCDQACIHTDNVLWDKQGVTL